MRGDVSKITVALALLGGCLTVPSCSDDGGNNPDGGGGAGGSGLIADAAGDRGQVGCLTAPPTTCPTPRVTYEMVQPIMQARCVSVCHNGTTPDPNPNPITPNIWPLASYKDITDWNDTIRSSMADCSMPPADAGVPVTVEERKAIIEFIRCEYPTN